MTIFSDAVFNAPLVEPEQPPREVWVKNSRDGVLAHIGGDAIHRHDTPEDAACFLFNAALPGEGRRLNRAVLDENGNIAFIISGPFLIAGRLYPDRLRSLCPEQARRYQCQFLTPHVFIRENNKIVLWRGGETTA